MSIEIDPRPSPKFFLVRLDDVPRFQANGIFHHIALTPGVLCVFAADLSGLPADRLAILAAEAKLQQGDLFAEVQLSA